MDAPDAKDPGAATQPVPSASTHAPWIPSPRARLFTLAWTSLACGWMAAAGAYLVLMLQSWEPYDGPILPAVAMGMDPGIMVFLLLFATPATFLGFLAGVALLWDTDLTRSIPTVGGSTIVTATAFGQLGFLAMVPALVVGLIAMGICRFKFAVPDRRQPPSALLGP